VLPRIRPTNCWEVARSWSDNTDEEKDENKAEEKAVINGQETEDVGDHVEVNFSEQNEESGKEDQEEKPCEAMRRLQGRARRARIRSSLHCPLQQI
jgi:hypothetical protein